MKTKKEVLIHITAWMKVENMLSRSQTQKATYGVIPFV